MRHMLTCPGCVIHIRHIHNRLMLEPFISRHSNMLPNSYTPVQSILTWTLVAITFRRPQHHKYATLVMMDVT